MGVINAKITSTQLGKEDHGILTCFIMLDYGGSGQGFGGYSLSQWGVNKNSGNDFGIKFIEQILTVVGVDQWEDLVGKHVRVQKSDELNSQIEAIGHIIEDKWFNPGLFAKGYQK